MKLFSSKRNIRERYNGLVRDTETITRVDGAVRSALLVKASHSINRSGVASARPLRLDSGYSSALTLFYYFHFIILIRVRLASALFACAQPPRPAHRARPMAAALTTRARRHAPAHAPSACDIATMLIVSNDSHFALAHTPQSTLNSTPSHRQYLHLPPRDNFNVATYSYIAILAEIPPRNALATRVAGASRQSSISNKLYASEKLF